MSSERTTPELVARLADGLAPVRPARPLRHQALAVAGAWLLSAIVVAGWLGLQPVARGALSTGLLCLLALTGVGGLALGLAGRLPGRERLAVAAAACAAAGVAGALALGLALGPPIAAASVLEGIDCTRRSLSIAIPVGVLALGFSQRGAPWRRGIASLGLALGAASLGALLIHLSCPSPSAEHWLIAHALAPLAAGTAASLLVAIALRLLDRGSAQPL